jgi:acetylornithine deacetylase/succinyl-diaminopimelate desuccinylase-like protein
MPETARQAALRHVDARFPAWVDTLRELCRIPSVSAAGFPPGPVQQSADAMADLLRRIGMRKVRRLEVSGVHPYVYGEWLEKKGAPTVLLYGHHDVVPPGRPEKWQTPAFEPQERGGRLYARGSADDKGGILAHVAAVDAFLATSGELPLNVRFLIEGEEEIGSQNLPRLLEQHADLMQADYVVLSDTSNFETGWPALTTRLRGLVQVDVEVSCLERPVHSGQKGGPVPDAVQVLSQILARLSKKDGSLNVPGLYDDVAKPTAAERRELRALAFDERAFRRAAGLLKGVRLAGEQKFSIYEQLWTRPSLTVIAFEARPIQGSSNQIVESARARISMRTVPDMDGRQAAKQLIAALTADPPHHARVEARLVRTTPWWKTDPTGPAFDAARRALRAGYGKDAAFIGAGGSIGFVQPFTDHLPGVPCLLVGVEDPPCNAHSENESLHLGDWKKCMRSAVHLYEELAALR